MRTSDEDDGGCQGRPFLHRLMQEPKLRDMLRRACLTTLGPDAKQNAWFERIKSKLPPQVDARK